MSPVPLLDLKIHYESIRTEIDEALLAVVRDQRFILGPEVVAFEQEMASYLGVSSAIGVSSGSDAIIVALLALGVGPGDEVITTAYSFFATAGSIVRCGASPILVDIDPTTYNLDPIKVAERISPRTRAVLPVHLFGRCAPTEELQRIAGEIPLVEDAAQAIGAERRGKRAGRLGRIGCFSFFPSKNLGGFGDGGLVSTDDPELASRMRSLRVHGQKPGGGQYLHELLGGNFRLDALQAAVLRIKLRHLDRWTERRTQNAVLYRRLFREAGAEIGLPPEAEPGCRDVYNQFVIRLADRDALHDHLTQQGIGTAIYYPRGLHQQPCLAHLGHQLGDFPHAEAAARESLALPIYPELTPQQIEEVVDRVVGFLRGQRAGSVI